MNDIELPLLAPPSPIIVGEHVPGCPQPTPLTFEVCPGCDLITLGIEMGRQQAVNAVAAFQQAIAQSRFNRWGTSVPADQDRIVRWVDSGFALAVHAIKSDQR